jgi:hypothetical protein
MLGLGLAVLIMVGLPIAHEIHDPDGAPIDMWISGSFALAALCGVYFSRQWKWRTVDERVKFSPPVVVREELPRPALPPPPRGVETDPFRAPPSTPIVLVQTAAPPAPTPIVEGDPTDAPQFLR